jgi:hypothetical protein
MSEVRIVTFSKSLLVVAWKEYPAKKSASVFLASWGLRVQDENIMLP